MPKTRSAKRPVPKKPKKKLLEEEEEEEYVSIDDDEDDEDDEVAEPEAKRPNNDAHIDPLNRLALLPTAGTARVNAERRLATIKEQHRANTERWLEKRKLNIIGAIEQAIQEGRLMVVIEARDVPSTDAADAILQFVRNQLKQERGYDYNGYLEEEEYGYRRLRCVLGWEADPADARGEPHEGPGWAKYSTEALGNMLASTKIPFVLV
jgi:hypothetical protein